jgi:hypothetical protein
MLTLFDFLDFVYPNRGPEMCTAGSPDTDSVGEHTFEIASGDIPSERFVAQQAGGADVTVLDLPSSVWACA